MIKPQKIIKRNKERDQITFTQKLANSKLFKYFTNATLTVFVSCSFSNEKVMVQKYQIFTAEHG